MEQARNRQKIFYFSNRGSKKGYERMTKKEI